MSPVLCQRVCAKHALICTSGWLRDAAQYANLPSRCFAAPAMRADNTTAPEKRKDAAPHGNCVLIALGLIVRSDSDLLSSRQLDGFTIFQEACPDLWALQKLSI